MSHNPCRLISTNKAGAFQGHLKNETLAFVYSTAEARGLVLAVASEAAQSTRVESEIESQIESFGFKGGLRSLEAKLVGPRANLDNLKRIFHRLGITVANAVERDPEGLTFIAYPDTGRLRIEKGAGLSQAPGLAPLSEPVSLKPDVKKVWKVLVIDDSPTICKLLTSVFSSDPDLKVVGSVGDPLQAEAQIEKLQPDVITLDIHMPGLNGVELLKRIHPRFGIPTVMVTSISREEGPLVLDALEAGAIDYLQKPSMNEVKNLSHVIIEKVKTAAASKRQAQGTKRSRTSASAPSVEVVPFGGKMAQNVLVAIGSSTGGTEALRELLTRLPADIPPIVIVQHIPAVFSEALAKRLDSLCRFSVKEAADNDMVVPNQVLIAPGGKQMEIVSAGSNTFKIRITDGPMVNRHKPSVDVLFDSVASLAGKHAIGVILTGMGGDGAKGLLKMKERGARTIAQDEASCVVFGMPREAIRIGAAEEIVPLEGIAAKLVRWLSKSEAA